MIKSRAIKDLNKLNNGLFRVSGLPSLELDLGNDNKARICKITMLPKKVVITPIDPNVAPVTVLELVLSSMLETENVTITCIERFK